MKDIINSLVPVSGLKNLTNIKSGTSVLDGLMSSFTSTFTPRCN